MGRMLLSLAIKLCRNMSLPSSVVVRENWTSGIIAPFLEPAERAFKVWRFAPFNSYFFLNFAKISTMPCLNK
jgi:hypothetical protein